MAYDTVPVEPAADAVLGVGIWYDDVMFWTVLVVDVDDTECVLAAADAWLDDAFDVVVSGTISAIVVSYPTSTVLWPVWSVLSTEYAAIPPPTRPIIMTA